MIDADLFQILTLGLLGLVLLVALLIYSAVAALRKSGGASQAAPIETGFAASPVATSVAEYAAPQQAAPMAASVTRPEPAPLAATTTAAAPVGEAQDQPFERDGRWWFRRGADLLVYDERTGQWVAAPAQTLGADAGAPAAATAAAGTTTLAGEQAAGGAFWKCPSCGAVNGATAATCRMCFTARP